MERTGRRPSDVMGDAVAATQGRHVHGAWGADADHLKTEEHVNQTAGAGFVFFTIDPSEYVDQQADNYGAEALRREFGRVQREVSWVEQYRGRTIKPDGGPEIVFDATTVQRAAVKYGRAIAHAVKLAEHIDTVMAKCERDYEIELSVDETEQPTTAAEHYIIAEQCLRSDMKLVSLAPRYVGDFEKGIDFKGDIQALRRSLDEHAAIARHLGPYKLSLHSGSDKLSMYEIFALCTRGMFHVKTAGTSYLEALRVVVRHDPALMRRIVDFARAIQHRQGHLPHLRSAARRAASDRHRQHGRAGADLPEREQRPANPARDLRFRGDRRHLGSDAAGSADGRTGNPPGGVAGTLRQTPEGDPPWDVRRSSDLRWPWDASRRGRTQSQRGHASCDKLC